MKRDGIESTRSINWIEEIRMETTLCRTPASLFWTCQITRRTLCVVIDCCMPFIIVRISILMRLRMPIEQRIDNADVD